MLLLANFVVILGRFVYYYRMSKYYTTKEAARYLGVTAARIRQLILEDRIKSEKMGRDHIISKSELADYQKQGKRKPGRPLKNSLR